MHPNGPEFSNIAAGLWRMENWDFTPSDTLNWIESCIKLGITTFDHADVYGSYSNEERFGEALKLKPALREKLELISKCDVCVACESRPENSLNHYNTSQEYIRRSVERSLKNLQTDRLDLLLIHRPDPLMDADATAEALMKLHDEGKIRHIGLSNFTPYQVDLLQSRLDVPIVTNQVECSLHQTNTIFDGTLDQAQQLRAAPMIWSPFAGGLLFTGNDERSVRIRDAITPIAKKYNASVGQIALAWLLTLPSNPVPVVGTGKIHRLKEAAEAVNINLERQDWFSLLAASQGHPVP